MSTDVKIENLIGSAVKSRKQVYEDGSRELSDIEENYYKNHYTHRVYDLRIQFAWATFLLVVVWLAADIIVIFASGISKLSVRMVYINIGALLGLIFGILLGKIVFFIWYIVFNKKYIDEKNDTDCFSWILSMFFAVIGAAGIGWWGSEKITKEAMLPFHLSDAVLITMITTTTASVIGILILVFNWLFPNKKKAEDI